MVELTGFPSLEDGSGKSEGCEVVARWWRCSMASLVVAGRWCVGASHGALTAQDRAVSIIRADHVLPMSVSESEVAWKR